jgi:hypothetical protein
MPPQSPFVAGAGDPLVQDERNLRQIIESWDRRLLTLARVNPDMPQAEISAKFMKLGDTLKFAEDMEKLRPIIDRIIAQQAVFEVLDVMMLLRWVDNFRKDKEARDAAAKTEEDKAAQRRYSRVWGVVLVVLTAVLTAAGEYLIHK